MTIKSRGEDFPGDPIVKTSSSNVEAAGSISGQGAKIPHALWPKKIKPKQTNKQKKNQKKTKNRNTILIYSIKT